VTQRLVESLGRFLRVGFAGVTVDRRFALGRLLESFEKAEHGLQGWVVRAVFE
jgi:hypothetical protein